MTVVKWDCDTCNAESGGGLWSWLTWQSTFVGKVIDGVTVGSGRNEGWVLDIWRTMNNETKEILSIVVLAFIQIQMLTW